MLYTARVALDIERTPNYVFRAGTSVYDTREDVEKQLDEIGWPPRDCWWICALDVSSDATVDTGRGWHNLLKDVLFRFAQIDV